MASIDGGTVLAAALITLSGALDGPKNYWTEVDIQMPATQHAYRSLNQLGELSSDRANGSAQTAPSNSREKISPKDFFRIAEIAPKAIDSPTVLKELPTNADALLHIKTSSGTNYYFAGEQERFNDAHAQEIWAILRKYHNSAW